MKPPEEIKKGLEQCANTETCENCGYRDECMDLCSNKPMTKDALSYIQQLESQLEQVERERDAAVNDLEKAISMSGFRNLDCEFCEDRDKPTCSFCYWIWRGVCPENTKEE